MRPIGAAVHLRRGTVNRGLVGWMVLGSVPMAFLGAYLLHLIGHAKTAQQHIEVSLGAALLARRRGDGVALRARPPRRTHAHGEVEHVRRGRCRRSRSAWSAA